MQVKCLTALFGSLKMGGIEIVHICFRDLIGFGYDQCDIPLQY